MTVDRPLRQPDPLHSPSGGNVRWSTVNVGEVLPGVPSPLTWTLLRDSCDVGVKKAYRDLGVTSRRRPVGEVTDDRTWETFFGHVAMNVDLVRMLADNLPGTSGDAVEQQLMAGDVSAQSSKPRRRRYPIVLPKLTFNAALLPRRLRRDRQELHAWWKEITSNPAPTDLDDARRRLIEAREHVGGLVMSHHFFCNMVAQTLYEGVRRLAEQAGEPGLELRLMSGQGSIEESLLLGDLWRASRGEIDLDAVIAEHGYHGPNPAEISETSWRTDRQLVVSLVNELRQKGEAESPHSRDRGRQAERVELERALIRRLPRRSRLRARVVLRLCRKYLPLRQVGKTTRMHAYDVARWAANGAGELLFRQGAIAAPEDVYAMTFDELVLSQPRDLRTTISARHTARAKYMLMELPQSWVGTPTPEEHHQALGNQVITGLPASSGRYTGPVRLVTDIQDAVELRSGDVLVCKSTNPSWASILQIVGAMVVDVGGTLSHAAITARELGVPCIVNTRMGTSVFATGDMVTVDGAAGTVELVVPTPATNVH